MTDVNLSIDDGNLSIKGEKINEWNHELFFKVVIGFKPGTEIGLYYLEVDENIFSFLKEITLYLAQEGLSYDYDSKVSYYLEIIQKEQENFVVSLANSDLPEPKPIPSSIKRDLYPFQKKAFYHLIAVTNGANFSVPGSGKTTVIYTTFEYLKEKHIIDKLFVIGPVSSFMPWEEEGVDCIGHPYETARLFGSKNYRSAIYSETNNLEVFLCTYQTLANDLSEISKIFFKHNFFLVIDESHNIKKFKGGVWSNAAIKLSRFAKRRAILSGTPMPNGLEDIWTQFTFLWPSEQVLGDKNSYSNLLKNTNSLEKVRKRVSPFISRVKKSQLNLPDPDFNLLKCKLSPYQEKIYEALAIQFLQQINIAPEEKRYLRKWRRAKLVRLIQTASNPSLLSKYSLEFDVPPLSGDDANLIDLIEEYTKYEIPGKFIGLEKLVKKLATQGEKVIIWSSFIHNIEMLEVLLAKYQIFKVYGEIAKDENENEELNREQQIREFKRSKEPALLIANPAACAESISLHTVCNNAIYLDRTFNAGQYLQSLDRIHRIGMGENQNVTYHLLSSINTIDETIHRRLIEKEINMLSLLDGDFPIGDFTLEQHQMEENKLEEEKDYYETIKDIRKHYEYRDP